MTIIRKLIRADGTETELHGPHAIQDIETMIGAHALDTVLLRSWGGPLHVMLVDDTGSIDSKPVNDKATQLYHAQCYPGVTRKIHGDVVVVPDSDYARGAL